MVGELEAQLEGALVAEDALVPDTVGEGVPLMHPQNIAKPSCPASAFEPGRPSKYSVSPP